MGLPLFVVMQCVAKEIFRPAYIRNELAFTNRGEINGSEGSEQMDREMIREEDEEYSYWSEVHIHL